MTMVETLEVTSVADEGYVRIRGDIIFGRLKPSQRLRLEVMRKDYGLSVTTLREVLNRLASEKLVVAEGKRGFEVAPISIGNLKELADLRLLLECHAIEQSFERADVEWEGRVVSAHHKLAATEKLMKSQIGSSEQWKQYDSEFHQALISNCGSATLMEAHAAAFDRYFRYQMITFKFRDEAPVRQHRDLLDYALKRDAAKAKKTLKEHVGDCVHHTISHWPNKKL
ncbi:GntR family transcriptional regulator [Pseudorhodoplanes sp.]|uniref:GntR family transcriptional regulator n=1 Tax=Pseudorhodoplanes sp. TaxID=1934341 RepID=UPI002D074E68|nr:GntR family transcriptional regulator [Pseudorhodoplanes sp.]HWV55484.1 GntR family transcriptional regulator [Pseudorhodoplanes sp.]